MAIPQPGNQKQNTILANDMMLTIGYPQSDMGYLLSPR